MDPIDFIYEVSLVDLRVFEYALEIARQRSFTKAAAHLHITQPTISQQIAKLEEELGVRLFYRDARGISPTPEGVLFLKRAKQILALKEDLKRELFERVVGMGETLTIGATPITVRHLLPSLLEQFQSRYPNVQIHLMEESPEVLHHLTAQGSVDLSILALPVEDPRIATRPMFTKPDLRRSSPSAQTVDAGSTGFLCRKTNPSDLFNRIIRLSVHLTQKGISISSIHPGVMCQSRLSTAHCI